MKVEIPRYSEQLRQLTDEYYYQQVSSEEYRRQRKQILDAIDRDINHIDPAPVSPGSGSLFDFSKK